VLAVRAAYRGGKATLTELLAAHRAEIDAHLKSLELEAAAARLWAQLAFLNAPPESFTESTLAAHTDQGALP
jgi:outer membrane protein TolC